LESEPTGFEGRRSLGEPEAGATPGLDALPADARSAELLAASLYRSILHRDPDAVGFDEKAGRLRKGETVESVILSMLLSPEYSSLVVRTAPFIDAALRSQDFVRAFQLRLSAAPKGRYADLFPEDYVGNAEAGKFYNVYRGTGLLEKYLSGDKVLDIGFKGYDNPKLLTIVPHAIGVDLDYPGYDGERLPFDDGAIDTVFSSHCLEHIADYKQAIQDWYRVLKVGGFIVCAVPSQLLYEKRRSLPSKYNADHKRFYSPRSLVAEFEQALEENSYRVRFLEENDRDYTYHIGPDDHAGGCYEIVIVVEKIRKPAWTLES
jgi:SAM-dependent methyltransferase